MDRDQILAALEQPTEALEVPAWGSSIRIRAISIGDTTFTSFCSRKVGGEEPDAEEVMARRIVIAVILGVIDDAGDPVFDLADAAELRSKHWATLCYIAEAVFSLSGRGTVEGVEGGKGSSKKSRPSASSTS